jgi:uncharacterized protein (TIGR03437 family)
MPNGFTVQSALSAASQTQPPVVALPIGNGDPTQGTIFPGSTASIYGFNLGQNSGAVQVTLNDVTVPVIGLAVDHVNIQIPSNFPTGLAVVRLSVSGTPANPVLMQIDSPPPTIVRVASVSGVNFDALHFAAAGDVINVTVSGLDPAVLNNQSRLSIQIAGVSMAPQAIDSLGGGQYQIRFYLTQGFGSTSVPLAVVVDGSASLPSLLPVR